MILLASASPRRAEILKRHGVEFIVDPANIDESVFPEEEPEAYVLRIARTKAADRAARANARAEGCSLVLAADTSVVIDGRILGKPRSYEDFCATMKLLSGNTHTVLSAVALISLDETLNQNLKKQSETHIESFVVKTNVIFRTLTEQEVSAYWQTGEPADKAGGYAIQGLAAEFVRSIEGSYSNVVGLPICETLELLKSHEVASCLTGSEFSSNLGSVSV